jgi:hypothetical protein
MPNTTAQQIWRRVIDVPQSSIFAARVERAYYRLNRVCSLAPAESGALSG